MAQGLASDMMSRLADGLDVVLRRNDRFTPPRRLRHVADGDYIEAGETWLGLLRSLALVRPDERVLEIGCGPGMLARPLERHLGPGARYVGVDDDEIAINWCQSAYRDRPDFSFEVVGDLDAPGLELPFLERTFDVVIINGALSRLAPDAVAARLREARRLLLDEGRLFVTAYLLDETAREALQHGRAAIAFDAADQPAGAVAEHLGEAVHAIDEEWLLDRVAEAGFKTVGIRHGSWTPREDTKAFPDILVARL